MVIAGFECEAFEALDELYRKENGPSCKQAAEAVRGIYRAMVEAAPAAVHQGSVDYAADAQAWGDALNDAGWRYMAAHKEIIGEPVSAKLWNFGKAVLREAILAYVGAVTAKALATHQSFRDEEKP
jgi:hypothetical protein